MTYKEIMRKAMDTSMDDLDAMIGEYRRAVEICEEVKRMRNKAGERTTRQQKAADKAATRKAAKGNNPM